MKARTGVRRLTAKREPRLASIGCRRRIDWSDTTVKEAGDSLAFVEKLMQESWEAGQRRWSFLASASADHPNPPAAAAEYPRPPISLADEEERQQQSL